MLDKPVSLSSLTRIRARLRTYENPDNPCVYQWNFRASSGNNLPEGDIIPVTPEELGTQTISKIVSSVEGLNSPNDMLYLTNDDVAGILSPTDAMEEAVKEDEHELVGRFNALKVDTEGYYVMKIVLTDELYNKLKDLSIDDLKVYALHDTEVDSAIINGIVNTWEVLTLTGHKPTKIDAKTFLLVGLLNAGQPFSMFIAKTLLSLFTGGSGSCGIGLGLMGIISAGLFLLQKRHQVSERKINVVR